ncbi:MAG: hypothetical protein V1645_01260 [archaeon]
MKVRKPHMLIKSNEPGMKRYMFRSRKFCHKNSKMYIRVIISMKTLFSLHFLLKIK